MRVFGEIFLRFEEYIMINQSWLQSWSSEIIITMRTYFADGAVLDLLYNLSSPNADSLIINNVPQDSHNAAFQPGISVPWLDSPVIQISADVGNSDAIGTGIEPEDKFHDRSFVRIRSENPSTPMFELHALPAVGCLIERPFSFLHGSSHTGAHPAADCLVFPPAHEESELKVFFVKFIIWIIGLCWSDDLRSGILESSLNNSLIDRITSCQTFHFHYEYTFPTSGFYFG